MAHDNTAFFAAGRAQGFYRRSALCGIRRGRPEVVIVYEANLCGYGLLRQFQRESTFVRPSST